MTAVFTIAVPTVSSMGELPSGLPWLTLPGIPLNLETLQTIAPYALGLALVGLLESLMTAKVVDDATDTHSSKTRESLGQGIGNTLVGAFGGMASCAMVGQTMVNVKSGAKTRLSTFAAGGFLLLLVVALRDVVGMIPMAVLVAFVTFDWHSISLKTLKKMPTSETITMIATVAATVATHNLAIGVGVGVMVAMIVFARKASNLVEVTSVTDPDGRTEVYAVTGQLFFASSNQLVEAFDYHDQANAIVIDLTDAHIWDSSAVAALDAVQEKFHKADKKVEIIGFNKASKDIHETLSGELTTAH